MRTSDKIDEISLALSKAQGQMKNPEKNKKATIPTKSGGGYSYDYADLPSTFDALRKPLADNGIMHTSAPRFVDGQYVLFSRLSHCSGQWIEAEWPLPNVSDPKLLAGAITYGTRYLFNSLCGIAGDDDLDHTPESPSSRYEPRRPASKPSANVSPQVEHGQREASQGHADLGASPAHDGKFGLLAKLRESKWTKEHLVKYCSEIFGKSDSKSLSLPELQRLVNAQSNFATLEDALKAEAK